MPLACSTLLRKVGAFCFDSQRMAESSAPAAVPMMLLQRTAAERPCRSALAASSAALGLAGQASVMMSVGVSSTIATLGGAAALKGASASLAGAHLVRWAREKALPTPACACET